MLQSCVHFSGFPPQPSDDESSSDETSNRSSPTLRRRRAKKRLVSNSESEGGAPNEQDSEPPKEQQHKRQFSSGLNRCIILALVIAISMGFGHFYGKYMKFELNYITDRWCTKCTFDIPVYCDSDFSFNIFIHVIGSLVTMGVFSIIPSEVQIVLTSNFDF